MGDHVWVAIGAIVVAVRWLGVVICVVMIVGRVVACEGLVYKWAWFGSLKRFIEPIHKIYPNGHLCDKI
jgi:hypothetical protein